MAQEHKTKIAGKRKIPLGVTQQKILLLLFGGLGLVFSYNPRNYFRLLKEISNEWKAINSGKLRRSVDALYGSGLIRMEKRQDESYLVRLTREGTDCARRYSLSALRIKKPIRWDGLWRIVLFDIPEVKRTKRDILREHLRGLDFYEFQKSVFVHPYNCAGEIAQLVEAYSLDDHVRFVIAKSLDNESRLKTHFKLWK